MKYLLLLGIVILLIVVSRIARGGVGALLGPPPAANEIPVETLKEWLDAGQPIAVIDVRSEAEWSAGHIRGATHIPVASIPERVSDIRMLTESGKTVALICRTQHRSRTAHGVLSSHGLGSMVVVTGGMDRWKSMGYNVAT